MTSSIVAHYFMKLEDNIFALNIHKNLFFISHTVLLVTTCNSYPCLNINIYTSAKNANENTIRVHSNPRRLHFKSLMCTLSLLSSRSKLSDASIVVLVLPSNLPSNTWRLLSNLTMKVATRTLTLVPA